MDGQEDLKSLFVQWIEDAAVEATQKGSKVALLYNRALFRLRAFEGPITDPKTLRSIQYVGDKTVKQLTQKLIAYCKKEGREIPPEFDPDKAPSVPSSATTNEEPPTKKPRKKKRYVPRHRSGGFAILVALYMGDKSRRGLRKDEIIARAAPFADKSFTSNPAANDFYSAWSSIKVLMNNDLVSCSGRPKLYFLTDEGYELAIQLKQTVGSESSPIREVDISYDNNIQVSPDSSYIRPSSELSHALLDMPSSPVSDKVQRQQMLPPLAIHDKEARVYNGTKYDVWPSSEYEIILLIDTREIRSQQERDFFQTRLSSLGVKCEARALTVGDTLWIGKHLTSKKEVVLNYICERKKLDDLAMSIRDGRFQEQKNRLKKTGMKHYYYVVEESGIENVTDMMDSIRTAISMTMTVSQFYLRRFKDVDDTVQFLVSTTQVIKDSLQNTKLIVLRPRSINTQTEYSELLELFRLKFESRSTHYECVHLFSMFQDSMGKSGMMTVKEMFILMLMAIRGVSLERAVVIQNRFPTPKSLLDFYHLEHSGLDPEKKKRLLMDEFSDQVGNKKIGKVCSENIYAIWGIK